MGFEGKILHLPFETAGQMGTISRAQRKLGCQAYSVSFKEPPFGYSVDRAIDTLSIKKKHLRLLRQALFAGPALFRYDVFHFHIGRTFLDKNRDLPYLKHLKRKMLMHYWGSEIRSLEIALKKNKYVRTKGYDEVSLRKKMASVARYIDVAVVADYELREYVDGFFKRIEIIPQAIDLENYVPVYPQENGACLNIIHAPSHSWVKGTDHIEPVIKKLKRKFDINYILVQNKPHQEALDIYKKADVIIDQLLIGSYGIFSIEAMALGKPVLCHIREDLRRTYPSTLPILSANPDNLEAKLEKLCNDPDLRLELGKKGRLYVEDVHDSIKIAEKFIELYRRL